MKRTEHTFQNSVEGKVCSHCHTWQAMNQYANNRDNRDGKSTQCRQCHAAYNKAYHAKIKGPTQEVE